MWGDKSGVNFNLKLSCKKKNHFPNVLFIMAKFSETGSYRCLKREAILNALKKKI